MKPENIAAAAKAYAELENVVTAHKALSRELPEETKLSFNISENRSYQYDGKAYFEVVVQRELARETLRLIIKRIREHLLSLGVELPLAEGY